MKFSLSFFNVTTRQTEEYTLEVQTIGQACMKMIAYTIGKDVRRTELKQEDE